MLEMQADDKRHSILLYVLYFGLISAAAFGAIGLIRSSMIRGRAAPQGISDVAVEAPAKVAVAKPPAGIWDPSRYISIDEIKRGMTAYCLTVYEGTKAERFALEVVSVVRNFMPGRNAILVMGKDERFIHTGPVAGCSGSPVYIDGRLAGALAFAWFYSKDPLYGVTPIEEMLQVGQGERPAKAAAGGGFVFDFSKPIDLADIDRQARNQLLTRGPPLSGPSPLPCPLVTSGLPPQVCEELDEMVKPLGLMVVAGGGSGGAKTKSHESVQLEPGACLAVPLLSGDMDMSVFGTVTEVRGDRVYGFGHSFLGYGAVNLPIATGHIHTVVSSVSRSMKLASVLETVGALQCDESAAVLGRIGAEAKTIPLTITVERYNDTEKRQYKCLLVDNQLYTPMVLRSAVSGAVLYLGDLPPDHTIEYRGTIGLEGAEPITFENVSTSLGVVEMMMESASSVTLLMNNPYKRVDIESFDFDIRVVPKNIVAHVWSVDVSDPKVKAGETVEVSVVVESFLDEKRQYRCGFEIPEDLQPGQYELSVCGASAYEQFLRKAMPYKFLAQNMPSLIQALRDLLNIERDKLYCLLVLPPGGVTVEKAELPDLPPTKALVLQHEKRALRTQPYQHWLEKTIETGTVIIDKKTVRIRVEK